MQYWSAFIGFSKYTAFHVDAVVCVKYYLMSENRVLIESRESQAECGNMLLKTSSRGPG